MGSDGTSLLMCGVPFVFCQKLILGPESKNERKPVETTTKVTEKVYLYVYHGVLLSRLSAQSSTKYGLRFLEKAQGMI
jgi:hypothetical protein